MFAAAFPLFGDQSKQQFYSIAYIYLVGEQINTDFMFSVYKKLGYQWATSLLAFLAVALMPFP